MPNCVVDWSPIALTGILHAFATFSFFMMYTFMMYTFIYDSFIIVSLFSFMITMLFGIRISNN